MRISDWSPDVCSSDLHRHYAKHHPPLLDQCDIDGEFLTARNELLGTVQRVHQPPALPAGAHALRNVGVLFGENRSEERRVGKECVSTCRSRWSQYHSNIKKSIVHTTTI